MNKEKYFHSCHKYFLTACTGHTLDRTVTVWSFKSDGVWEPEKDLCSERTSSEMIYWRYDMSVFSEPSPVLHVVIGSPFQEKLRQH